MQLRGAHVLVTGGSSGIGEATTKAMAALGASVTVVGRDQQRLSAVATAVAGRAYIADLADPASVRTLAERVLAERGVPDIVVNNAGAGRWLRVDETSPDELQKMTAVPFLAAFNLTRELLPGMMRRGTGHIVNLTSIAAFLVWPGAAGYTAARWAMRGFNESLRAELYRSGVGVSLVAFSQVSSAYWEHNPGSWERLPAAARNFKTLTPEDAAAAIILAVERERRLVLRPRAVYFLRLLRAIAPRAIERQLWK